MRKEKKEIGKDFQGFFFCCCCSDDKGFGEIKGSLRPQAKEVMYVTRPYPTQ